MYSLASILHETPVGLCRARSRRERERERDRFGRCIDTRGKKDGIRGSGYGAACKCYDPLLCSRSLFVPVLPPRLTRSARWHPWVLGSFAYLPSHGEEG